VGGGKGENGGKRGFYPSMAPRKQEKANDQRRVRKETQKKNPYHSESGTHGWGVAPSGNLCVQKLASIKKYQNNQREKPGVKGRNIPCLPETLAEGAGKSGECSREAKQEKQWTAEKGDLKERENGK